MKGVVVNAGAKIGRQCILNTNCTIEHHDILSQGVEIGPGATLCGRVNVKDFSWVGAGVTVLPRVNVGTNAIIGGGSLVRANVPDNNVVVGVPAKFLKHNNVKVKMYD